MERRVRITETIKTILILILLLTLVVMSAALVSELVTGRNLSRWAREALGWAEPELAYTEVGGAYPAAATPLAITMAGSNGRGSAVGDPTYTAALYESFGRYLGEALAMASAPVTLKRELWQALLCGESVSFLYPGQIPLESLALWLGAEPTSALSNLSAQWVSLCVDDSRVALLVQEDHTWLCFSTAISPEHLRQALESCRPDGSIFAMEDEVLSRIDPMSLLTVSTALRQTLCDNPLANGDRIDAAAELLGLNPYRDTAYTSEDGTVSFSAGTGRLQVTGGGTLTYQAAEAAQVIPGGDPALIDAARQLLMQLSDGLTGDASLQLSGFVRDGQTVRILFDYVLDGYAVRQSSGHGAEFVYENGSMRELRWQARRYTLTESLQTLLPGRQASAIVTEGTRLMPIYRDSGSGVTCGWPDSDA